MGFKSYGTKKKEDLKYEVIEKIGVLDSDSEYPKELRVVKWGNNIKYDLRSWKKNEDGTETPLKGCTFDGEEWKFVIPANVTSDRAGRYWYRIYASDTSLCFKQPIYLI